MAEPRKITAGLSYTWTKTLSLYKAGDGWSLAYSIVSQNAQYDVATVASGDDHVATITPTVSADYEAGAYRLVGIVTKGAESHCVFNNDLCIQPSPLTPGDFRSQAEKNLEAINAVIAESASKDQQMVMVDGQTLQRRTVADLLVLKDRFEREVRREKRARDVAAGVGRAGGVQVRFP